MDGVTSDEARQSTSEETPPAVLPHGPVLHLMDAAERLLSESLRRGDLVRLFRTVQIGIILAACAGAAALFLASGGGFALTAGVAAAWLIASAAGAVVVQRLLIKPQLVLVRQVEEVAAKLADEVREYLSVIGQDDPLSRHVRRVVQTRLTRFPIGGS